MIEIWPCDQLEVRAVLAAAEAPRCNPAGVQTLDEMCRAGQCFKLVDAGRIVGAYVVQPFDDELWITAAAGAAAHDLTKVIDAAVAHQGREFDAVVFTTARPGLVKKTMALGYTCTMRKNLR